MNVDKSKEKLNHGLRITYWDISVIYTITSSSKNAL